MDIVDEIFRALNEKFGDDIFNSKNSDMTEEEAEAVIEEFLRDFGDDGVL